MARKQKQMLLQQQCAKTTRLLKLLFVLLCFAQLKLGNLYLKQIVLLLVNFMWGME